jgi:hypothetical protein
MSHGVFACDVCAGRELFGWLGTMGCYLMSLVAQSQRVGMFNGLEHDVLVLHAIVSDWPLGRGCRICCICAEPIREPSRAGLRGVIGGG